VADVKGQVPLPETADGCAPWPRTSRREMARDPLVGRSEALRRSMLALIDKGAPHEAHPAVWAPFVLVGEGAAGR
jgi:hypothetical protein